MLRVTAADPKERARDLAELTAVTARVADGWWRLYQRGDHEDWDDFQHYKANGRWANGAQRELEELDPTKFTTRSALLDAAAQLLRVRPWDTDYEEPVNARRQMLDAVVSLRDAAPQRR